ncbi:hypothetical protein BN1723_014638, partial [Verticillium longisporum]
QHILPLCDDGRLRGLGRQCLLLVEVG